MPNEEVLGPRKTMFVLVIVVGCFAVLWPRILSPLILGQSRDQLKPNAFDREAAVKQERPSTRGAGPHPALRERGRAIPAGAAPPRTVTAMPPHVRVRSSPLSVYYELDIKPPPIPGMRPPLGSPGGPVPTPKSSMGFVMPIYTICIIVFFVYTLSKILFKRTASPYEPLSPDPQFRSRVFRDDSRSSPDKLGPKERDTIVTAISGLVAEVRQQMDASYAQNQQRQEAQDEPARPYTNGTILHNTGPVHIVTSEYREASKENSPEPQKEALERAPEVKEASPEPEKATKESLETKDSEELPAKEQPDETSKIPVLEQPESKPYVDQEKSPEGNDLKFTVDVEAEDGSDEAKEESGSEPELIEINHKEDELMNLTNDVDVSDGYVKVVQDFLNEESKAVKQEKQSTPELLEEAIKEDSPDKAEDDQENASVKVVGMEVTAHTVDGGAVPRAPPPAAAPPAPAPQRPHEAEEVKSIFLETEIPQKSRVLVTDFAEDRPEDSAPTSNSPMVVSGKMTLSLIQDAPRETPEKDPESTVDDFTTASAITQPPADKQAEEESEEEVEIEEEIEVEEIEEEMEDEEIEEIEEDEENEPVEAKEQVQVNEPVKVDEVKVTEPVQLDEPEQHETVEETVTEEEEIEEHEEKDDEPVKVNEQVKVTEPAKLTKPVKTEKSVVTDSDEQNVAKDDEE